MSDALEVVPIVSGPITGWQILATCPRCGGQFEHVASGRPSPGGGQIASVARCTACSAQLTVHVSLSASFGRPVAAQRTPPRSPQQGPS